MKRRNKLLFSAIAILLIFFICHELRNPTVPMDISARSGDRSNPTGIKLVNQDESIATNSKNKTRKLEPKPDSATSFSPRLRNLIDLLKKNEAHRCELVRETRVEGATCYFMKLEPPSPEEVRTIRGQMAKAMKETPASDKQKMDQWLEYLTEQYDPFGTEGRRILSIRVPDDPMKPLSAWSYPVDDVNEEVDRLHGGEAISAHPQMRFYVASELNNIERFQALIVP